MGNSLAQPKHAHPWKLSSVMSVTTYPHTYTLPRLIPFPKRLRNESCWGLGPYSVMYDIHWIVHGYDGHSEE